MKASDYRDWSPASVREIIRSGEWTAPTPGMCAGHVQANMIVLPKDWAYDFMVFAQRNPTPCPILDITEPGGKEARIMAPGSDVAKDIPRYRVWKDGLLVDEPYRRIVLLEGRPGGLPPGVFLLLRERPDGGGNTYQTHRGEQKRPYVRHIDPVPPCRSAVRPDGGQHEAHTGEPGSQGGSLHRQVPRGTRSSSTRRGPRGHRDKGHIQARLRRLGDHKARRGSRILGLWGYPPGGADGQQAPLRHNPRSGTHDDTGPQGFGPSGVLIRLVRKRKTQK